MDLIAKVDFIFLDDVMEKHNFRDRKHNSVRFVGFSSFHRADMRKKGCAHVGLDQNNHLMGVCIRLPITLTSTRQDRKSFGKY